MLVRVFVGQNKIENPLTFSACAIVPFSASPWTKELCFAFGVEGVSL
jgi:hypothetical protein